MRNRDLKQADWMRWGHSSATATETSTRGYLKGWPQVASIFVCNRRVEELVSQATFFAFRNSRHTRAASFWFQ